MFNSVLVLPTAATCVTTSCTTAGSAAAKVQRSTGVTSTSSVAPLHPCTILYFHFAAEALFQALVLACAEAGAHVSTSYGRRLVTYLLTDLVT